MTAQRDLFEQPTGYRTLLLDPPWQETGGSGGSWGDTKRGADRHYPLVATREIPSVVRSSGLWTPAEHAHCWMWATDNFLREALWVMHTLGFTYVRTAVWVKMPDPREVLDELLARVALTGPALARALYTARDALRPAMGLGQYLRGGHELLLFGTRGQGQHESVRTTERNVPSVMFGARSRHSRKPTSSYEMIERVSKGPRVEIFARSGRAGWTSWGNEIDAAQSAE